MIIQQQWRKHCKTLANVTITGYIGLVLEVTEKACHRVILHVNLSVSLYQWCMVMIKYYSQYERYSLHVLIHSFVCGPYTTFYVVLRMTFYHVKTLLSEADVMKQNMIRCLWQNVTQWKVSDDDLLSFPYILLLLFINCRIPSLYPVVHKEDKFCKIQPSISLNSSFSFLSGYCRNH